MRPDDCQVHLDDIDRLGNDTDAAAGILLGAVMGLLFWALLYSFLT